MMKAENRIKFKNFICARYGKEVKDEEVDQILDKLLSIYKLIYK